MPIKLFRDIQNVTPIVIHCAPSVTPFIFVTGLASIWLCDSKPVLLLKLFSCRNVPYDAGFIVLLQVLLRCSSVALKSIPFNGVVRSISCRGCRVGLFFVVAPEL